MWLSEPQKRQRRVPLRETVILALAAQKNPIPINIALDLGIQLEDLEDVMATYRWDDAEPRLVIPMRRADRVIIGYQLTQAGREEAVKLAQQIIDRNRLPVTTPS